MKKPYDYVTYVTQNQHFKRVSYFFILQITKLSIKITVCQLLKGQPWSHGCFNLSWVSQFVQKMTHSI